MYLLEPNTKEKNIGKTFKCPALNCKGLHYSDSKTEKGIDLRNKLIKEES